MGIKILILNWSSLLIFKFSKKMARRVPKAIAYRFFTLVGAFATVVTGLKYDEDRSKYFAFFVSIAYTVILAIFTYMSKQKDDW